MVGTKQRTKIRDLDSTAGLFGIMSQMPKRSAGLLMYRRRNQELEVFLVHPGGPFWAKKDFGAWSIPKGEYTDGQEPMDAARREFQEETGFEAIGPFVELGELKQPSGKIVVAWAFEGDCDAQTLRSNTFTMELPPRSGRQVKFPEVDRECWYSIDAARERVNAGQQPFLDRLKIATIS
jgi:predicted NUDIX family NTP pyrophosphohydrolase